jgi:hypothetical protein
MSRWWLQFSLAAAFQHSMASSLPGSIDAVLGLFCYF